VPSFFCPALETIVPERRAARYRRLPRHIVAASGFGDARFLYDATPCRDGKRL
jgi:hypothetical protein